MSLPLTLMMLFFILIIILGMVVSIFDRIANVAKWLGLGAILGNTINNKINADASAKSGRNFKKKRIQTNNKAVDTVLEFVSPSNDIGDEETNQEYQEFLKWKESQNKPQK